MLTFVIPVRHPSSIADQGLAKRLMAETLASIAAQAHPDWRCYIAAEKEADLPDLPSKTEVVETDIPAPDIPEMHVDKQASRAARHMDKGRRLMTALVAARPQGHVMVVDYDDLVSRRLAGLCAEQPEANGWYAESGWLYSGGGFMSAYPENFSRLCGTSIIINSRLLRIPRTMADFEPDYTARTLGDHIWVRQDLADAGAPLRPLPFPGAVYRMGHLNSGSVSVSMLSRIWNKSIMRSPEDVVSRLRYFRRFRSPTEIVRSLIQLRPVTASLRREFFGEAAA